MGSRVNRHLGSVLPELFTAQPPAAAALSVAGGLPEELSAEPSGDAAAAAGRPVLPPEFNWRDYTVMLLHTAAEIEHSLMVQYLFAAYSLGGPNVPTELREPVRRWQEIILGIAKEEMGHLVTVQNLLTALGAPLNLDREDYPWGSAFYPFPLTLRRLGLGSLATYICAESPADWSGDEADEIRELATQSGDGTPVNRVGALYRRLDAILADRDRIPDTAFQERTLPYQASWDEWGRGYTRGERGQDSGNVPDVRSPKLLILGVFSRDSARKALHDIGEQGEAFGVGPFGSFSMFPESQETSHFERFLSVYREMKELTGGDPSQAVRPVADNPRTGMQLDQDEPDTAAMTGTRTNVITHPVAALWGHLFNLRYRMLLVDLAHAFRLTGPLDDGTTLTARGTLIHRAFAEMYNLRAVAGKLVALPLTEDGTDGTNGTNGEHAGPPFEMPYTLDLPVHEYDRWLLQRDLVEASQLLVAQLRHSGAAPEDPYLVALEQTDELALDLIQGILSTNRE
ncbi:ferritin-like domain-containing protein [Embleya sp. NBC_00896]|uniref:ferritin-like domain-containing protein n=1 Tax=Embleya sp. NBC_00896 TaxID=2975961 RepID=UPI002F912BE5|nr:ferritin-like protein [Embleya sp. NBC_00896]